MVKTDRQTHRHTDTQTPTRGWKYDFGSGKNGEGQVGRLCVLLNTLYSSYYLAQQLCFWTGIIFIGVCMCFCLCMCLCIDYLNDKSSVPFGKEINRLVEEHTSPERMVKIDIKPTFHAIFQNNFNGIVYNFTLRCTVVINTLLVTFRFIALVEKHTSPKIMIIIDIKLTHLVIS